MTRQQVPEGFRVLKIEQLWYGVEIRYWYNQDEDCDELYLTPLNRNGCPRREDAVKLCQEEYENQQFYQQLQDRYLIKQSNLYPERCAHYQDLIEEITGDPPHILNLSEGFVVRSSFYTCRCGHHESIWVQAPYLEDALEELANQVYASASQCSHDQFPKAS